MGAVHTERRHMACFGLAGTRGLGGTGVEPRGDAVFFMG